MIKSIACNPISAISEVRFCHLAEKGAYSAGKTKNSAILLQSFGGGVKRSFSPFSGPKVLGDWKGMVWRALDWNRNDQTKPNLVIDIRKLHFFFKFIISMFNLV